MTHELADFGPHKAEILALSDAEVCELMDECSEEPADFEGCQPCFAYLVYQTRQDPDDKELQAMVHRYRGFR